MAKTLKHNGVRLDDLINYLQKIKEEVGGNPLIVQFDMEWFHHVNFILNGYEKVWLNPDEIREEYDKEEHKGQEMLCISL